MKLKTKLLFLNFILGSTILFIGNINSQTIENQQSVTKTKHEHDNHHAFSKEDEGKAYNLVKSLDLKQLKSRLIKEAEATEQDFERFMAFYEFNLRFYILELKEKVADPKFNQLQFEQLVNQKFRESVFEFKRFLKEDKEFKSRISENE